MLINRVGKRKSGYQRKKLWIDLPYTNGQVRDLVEKRTEEGYVLGWTKEGKGIKVYLRYSMDGVPSRTTVKRRWKPSRKWSVDGRKRWGTNGEVGRYLRQTSKGRKTSLEARKENLGGILYLWVR